MILFGILICILYEVEHLICVKIICISFSVNCEFIIFAYFSVDLMVFFLLIC